MMRTVAGAVVIALILRGWVMEVRKRRQARVWAAARDAR